jgi:nucleoside-diphosphate-sugar epimerase
MIRIIGSQGIIGRNLSRALFVRKDLVIQATESWDFDLPSEMKDDLIFYFRAVSSPFSVAKNPVEAFNINVVKTRVAIEAMLEKGARVIFASSDVVYGDTGIFFASENARIRPFGEYAIQKALIEECFGDNSNFLTVRLSTVVGEGSKLREGLLSQEYYEVFDPLIRNPIHIHDVIYVLKKLIDSDFLMNFPNGILNLGGSEAMSSYDLALLEAEVLGVNLPKKSHRSALDILARPGTVRMNSDLAQRFANLSFNLRRHYS